MPSSTRRVAAAIADRSVQHSQAPVVPDARREPVVELHAHGEGRALVLGRGMERAHFDS